MGKQRHDPGYKKHQRRSSPTELPKVSNTERMAFDLVKRGLASERILTYGLGRATDDH